MQLADNRGARELGEAQLAFWGWRSLTGGLCRCSVLRLGKDGPTTIIRKAPKDGPILDSMATTEPAHAETPCKTQKERSLRGKI